MMKIFLKKYDEFKDNPYQYNYKRWSEYTNIIKFVATDNDEEVEYNFQFTNNPKQYNYDWMKDLKNWRMVKLKISII